MRHSLRERFEARVVRGAPDACWPFQGARTGNNGYVHIARETGGLVYAHRVAWEFAHGPIPDGLKILHSCDSPTCVNPAHLFLGTQHDNILDSVRKGRYNCFGRQKLNAAQVYEIRVLAAAGHLHKDIARQFGIKRHSVSGIVNRKSWQHLGETA